MTRMPRQAGVVLVVSLLMLLVLSLLAVSAIGTSNTSLLIVNNMQSQQRAQALGQLGIERAISSIETFNNPAQASLTIDGETVTVSKAECLAATPATGYSAVWELAPEDTTWEVTATVTEGASGARATVVQGVDTRLVAGSCP